MATEQPVLVPEINTPVEIAKQKVAVEASPVAETIVASPVDPIQAPADDAQTAQVTPIEPEITGTIPAEEVTNFTDSSVDPKDSDWIGKVKDVIRDDKGQPFKEENDAENLNEEYMKSRFNIDVDATPEEK